MRKLEGVVKEIVDEMNYLKKREERFSSTNGAPLSLSDLIYPIKHIRLPSRVNTSKSSQLCLVHDLCARRTWCLANIPLARLLQAQVPH